MKDKRFSLRCDAEVLKGAKAYAEGKGVSLASLVDQLFRDLAKKQSEQPAPDEDFGVEQV